MILIQLKHFNIEARYPEDKEALSRVLTEEVCRNLIDETKKLQDKRAFLVYDNFKVILGYNQAPKYGITAGLIYEDLIAKAMNN